MSRRDLRGLSRQEEAIRDAALVEDFDGARGDAEGTAAREVLIGPPLEDGDVHARQRQLAREHESRRSGASDHDRMSGHRALLIGMRRERSPTVTTTFALGGPGP
jgi:hypothetical protein